MYRETFADERAELAHSVIAPSFAHVDAATAILLSQFDRELVSALPVPADGREAVASACICIVQHSVF